MWLHSRVESMVDSWGRKFLSLNNCSCGSARKGCYILWLYSRVDSMVDSMVEKMWHSVAESTDAF